MVETVLVVCLGIENGGILATDFFAAKAGQCFKGRVYVVGPAKFI
jgi:hypothetical protein